MEKKRSKLWNFFSVISENKAKCDLCQSTYSVKGGSTTNLKKHLLTKHRPSHDSLFASKPSLTSNSVQLQSSAIPQTNNNTDGDARSSNTASMVPKDVPARIQTDITRFVRKPISITREKKINDLILNMIIKDLQPFSVVEDSGFKDLINYIEPNYKIPSRYLLSTNLLDAKFALAKGNLKQELEGASYISLTTDAWTSRACTSYINVTAHYILDDAWELHSALLGCFECTARHTAENVKEELLKIVTEWEIEEKIFACVTDNARNMTAAIRETGWKHSPCYAHTLNLVVRASLDVIQHSLIRKVKSISEHFRRSPLATNKLKALQEQFRPGKKPLKLKIDVVTRWNSTFDMLERIAILQEPLEAAIGMLHNPVENLSEEEWQALPELLKILKPFKELTEEFSSEKQVSISKVTAATNTVKRILKNFRSTVKNNMSKQVLNKLIAEINSRFENIPDNISSKAALLDPRFKRLAFSDNSSYEAAKNSLKAELEELPTKQSFAEDEAEDVISESAVEEDSIWMEFDIMTSSNASSSTTTVSGSLITMGQYLEEKILNRQENPLKWWRAREILYPELADLAKKYLSVMSTSVPSERIFSKSGQILSDRRASLKPARVEKVLFLNVNQRLLKSQCI